MSAKTKTTTDDTGYVYTTDAIGRQGLRIIAVGGKVSLSQLRASKGYTPMWVMVGTVTREGAEAWGFDLSHPAVKAVFEQAERIAARDRPM